MHNTAHGRNWPEAVIFDLDGTLADTMPDVTASLNEVLGARELAPFEGAAVKRMIGDGLHKLMARALEARGAHGVSIESLVDEMTAVYAQRATRLTVLYDGVEKTLRRFRGMGIKMAVCTNKRQELADIVLRDLGIAEYFDAVIGARDGLPRKPDPAKLHLALEQLGIPASRAVMVGDSRADAGAAKAAEMPVILVSFGYSAVPVTELSPDAVIDNFGELRAIIDGLRTLR